ncbi:MAG: hypothetical protein M1828_003321 [Chrysothrix sp. TS-e1954]|nr:MAG: hypothetical protein M1828_003321 [Chrysothrix sp. TS-e1954]
MDGRGQVEYSQPGLSSPNQRDSRDAPNSEDSKPDQASAAAYHTSQQDVKYNPTATPNSSEYSLNPSSARSGTFPEYVHRPSYSDPRYPSASGAPVGNMAQPHSPSSTLLEERQESSNDATNVASDTIPVDPSIAASSPTYPPQHHYSPYANQHEMPQYHTPPMYPRPEYTPYPPPHGMPQAYGHVATSGGHPLSTVYSFVPIPGTHQQKRPRRRYEEIERMYKCGWQGCEKAYGTLNHLNAHVTMQAHGQKRTPEGLSRSIDSRLSCLASALRNGEANVLTEFKEIRKEWKTRKKEEDGARKADEERQRQAVQQGQPMEGHGAPEGAPQHHSASNGYGQGPRQLPPLGYAPASGQVPTQYTQAGAPQMDGLPQYSSGPMQSYGYPPSPYGQGQHMYHQPPSNSHVQ